MIFSRKSTSLALGSLCAALSFSTLQAQLVGKLKFENNDSLSGEIVSWTPTQITIKAKHFVEPVAINTAKIANIDFKHAKAANKKQEGNNITVIKLKNRFNATIQDTLVGNFTQIDDKHITLKTPYAGEFKIKREMIHSMEIESLAETIYFGPNNIEEWNNTLHTKSWEFKDNALVSGNNSGNIAKDVKLPNLAHIQFDHEWKTDTALSFYFYSNSTKESHPTNYYEFYFRHSSVLIRRYDGGRVTNLRPKNINNADRFRLINKLRQKRKAKYDLFLDKEKGIFHIMINGKLYDTYADPNPQPKVYGSAIHLSSTQNSPIRISNIKISKWSGYLNREKQTQEDLEKLQQKGQRITLKNGDSIIGEIGEVKGNNIEVKTAFAPIKIPINGLRSLDFSKTKENGPIMYPEDIKIWLTNSRQVIVKPISIKGSKLKAYHQGFGEVLFDLTQVKGIDLHPYDENYIPSNAPSVNW